MNYLIDNFDQILDFAEKEHLPITKKRGILREYLQIKILSLIYQEKASVSLLLTGGTGLRLLYGLDRFSEDLDFDLTGVAISPDKLLANVVNKLKQEGFELDFYHNITAKRAYFELRFKQLLFELKLGHNQAEKMMIKLDLEKVWRGHGQQVKLIKRFGLSATVSTISLDQFLVQKLVAYVNRKQTLSRDIYDIVWLITQNAQFDQKFAKNNGFNQSLILKAKKKFDQEKNKLNRLKLKLKPFLINEINLKKLEFFPQLLATLK